MLILFTTFVIDCGDSISIFDIKIRIEVITPFLLANYFAELMGSYMLFFFLNKLTLHGDSFTDPFLLRLTCHA